MHRIAKEINYTEILFSKYFRNQICEIPISAHHVVYSTTKNNSNLKNNHRWDI